ncbi:MAG: zinc finger domain-containing protein [Candidatus Aenigmatarchaeota archaeon]
MSKKLECSSCKKNLISEEGWVKFPCPSCEKVIIFRCKHCREFSITYTCENCGFQGP